MYKAFYRRNLPHQQPPGSVLFITFSIKGAIPADVYQELHDRALELKQQFTNPGVEEAENVIAWKRLFHFADEAMDKSNSAMLLANPVAARRTVQSILTGRDMKHYILHRYCVMGNHVHLLIEPLPMNVTLSTSLLRPTWPPLFYTSEGRQMIERNMSLDQVQWRPVHTIAKAIKRVTSPVLAQTSGLRGSMWMEESFDHWIRNGNEYSRVVAYIDDNPVKAGLCTRPEDWRWSMAYESRS